VRFPLVEGTSEHGGWVTVASSTRRVPFSFRPSSQIRASARFPSRPLSSTLFSTMEIDSLPSPLDQNPSPSSFLDCYGFLPQDLISVLSRFLSTRETRLPASFFEDRGLVSIGRGDDRLEFDAWRLLDQGIKLGGWKNVSDNDGPSRISLPLPPLLFLTFSFIRSFGSRSPTNSSLEDFLLVSAFLPFSLERSTFPSSLVPPPRSTRPSTDLLLPPSLLAQPSQRRSSKRSGIDTLLLSRPSSRSGTASESSSERGTRTRGGERPLRRSGRGRCWRDERRR